MVACAKYLLDLTLACVVFGSDGAQSHGLSAAAAAGEEERHAHRQQCTDWDAFSSLLSLAANELVTSSALPCSFCAQLGGKVWQNALRLITMALQFTLFCGYDDPALFEDIRLLADDKGALVLAVSACFSAVPLMS